MSPNSPDAEEQEFDDAENPLQFRLLELFGLMTVAALVSAIAAPLLRGLDSEFRNRLLVVIGLQLLCCVWAVVRFAKKRQRLLQESGRRLGAGFCGQLAWKWWPYAKALLVGALVLTVQLSLAVKMTTELLELGFVNGPLSWYVDRLPVSFRVLEWLHFVWLLDLLLYLQISSFAGYAFLRIKWRVFPNTVEFFQHGISRSGTHLTGWDCVDVRPSALFADRISLLVRASPKSIGGTTVVVQVSERLRKQVFRAVEATVATHSSDSS